jgi:hypothetical protein
MTETPEQSAQNAKFGYKAPESVYKKHDPKATLVGSGRSSNAVACCVLRVACCVLCILGPRKLMEETLTSLAFLINDRQGLHRCEPNGLLPPSECAEKGGKG